MQEKIVDSTETTRRVSVAVLEYIYIEGSQIVALTKWCFYFQLDLEQTIYSQKHHQPFAECRTEFSNSDLLCVGAGVDRPQH